MKLTTDKHTCSTCEAYIDAEGNRGHCHLNPPVMVKRDDQVDPYPMVDGAGKGCTRHNSRSKKK